MVIGFLYFALISFRAFALLAASTNRQGACGVLQDCLCLFPSNPSSHSEHLDGRYAGNARIQNL